jgi:hypothetical protein
MTDESIEGRVLRRHPDIREEVTRSADFQQWKDSLPSVVIDGELLFLPGGDVPRDEDQLIYSWALRHGVLTEADARAALED